MVFACQEDSFLKQYETKVVSCEKADLKTTLKGSKKTIKGYEVILENTILFPEGGGQPCDYGKLIYDKDGVSYEIPVTQVTRREDKAVHFIETPLEEGQMVKQVLDWERRHDHMQQHSGQHLITALADREFNYSTTSWWLGIDVSYIEMDTNNISPNQMEVLEKLCNDYIKAATRVYVEVYKEDDLQLKKVRTRGLPEDHKGDVRVVIIDGIESNMCCGTHVTNLSQLQCIKLLGVEKGKKGRSLLHFLAGDRVLKRMNIMLQREQTLSSLLNNSADVHVELVEKLQKALKLANKNLQLVLKDIAVLEAATLKHTIPKPTYFSLHRNEGDSDFVNVFIREVDDEDILLFLTTGDEKGAGQMVLHGKPELVSKLGPLVCQELDGKGAGKGKKFQAKVKTLNNRDKAENIIKKMLDINV